MNRSKPPRKKANLEIRSREYLTPNEMELLITTAKQIGRYGYRDATMIMMAYRHGLRVSEIVSLRWEQIDLPGALLHVCRKKNGISTTHPLYGVEIRALRKLTRDHPHSPYVFLTERNGPLTDSTFRKIVARVGEKANMPFSIHPHMLDQRGHLNRNLRFDPLN
jgi:type 1 fimbriae regulatory protein FimB/type 1 fimbriae regulatory protein FimE